MQGIYYTRGGATVAAPGFPKEGGGQANSLFLGGGRGFSIHVPVIILSIMQKIMDFNDLGFFFYKNEEN